MSLSIYLLGPKRKEECVCSACGHKHTAIKQETLFSCSITHNLRVMAQAVELYLPLWHLDECAHIKHAKDLVPILSRGINVLKKDPTYYQKFDAENGWGTYNDFVPCLEALLEACNMFPKALIEVSR